MNIKPCAVIGFGQIGVTINDDFLRKEIWSHTHAYLNNNRTNLVAVCDSDSNKLVNISNQYHKYTDFKKMIEIERPDIVSICTPTQTHYDIIKTLTTYPIKAIFCEKPLSYSSIDCEYAIDLCEENDIVLAVNYMRRWDNLYLEIKKIIETKELGNLKSIVCYSNTALYANASHMIDLIIMLCGDIKSIYGRFDTNYVREVHGIKDYGGIFHFSTHSDVEGVLYAYCNDKQKHQFEIDLQFDNGRLRSYGDGIFNEIYSYKDSFFRSNMKELYHKENINFIFNERMLSAIDNIIEAIENKNIKVNCSGQDAIKSIKVIEACYKSHSYRKIIDVI